MSFTIKRAQKSQAKLRLALVGTAGSGKTYSALSVALGLGQKILVIDTEHGSASKYAGDVADFDVIELDNFDPRNYIEAIQLGEQEGYDVIVVDSLSHAWNGRGGALEMVDNAAKRQQGNSFGAWRDITPIQNDLIDSIVRCRAHIIATMRAKTEYVVEPGRNGKSAPRKVGMAPVQRDGMDYEFDVVGELDGDHNLLISKSRCPGLDGKVLPKPGQKLAADLKAWLSDGAVPAPVIAPAEKANIVYCDCNKVARYVVKDGAAAWLCAEKPRVCRFRLDDTGQAGVVRTPALSAAAAANGALQNGHVPTDEEAPTEEDAYGPDDSLDVAPEPDIVPPAAPVEDVLTDAQHRAILAIGSRVFGHAATAEDFATICDTPVDQLNKSDASALIDRLRFMLAETGGEPIKATPPADKLKGNSVKAKAKALLDERIQQFDAAEKKAKQLFVDLIPDANVLGSEEFSEFMDAVNEAGLTLKSEADGDKFLEGLAAKTGTERTVDDLTKNDFYELAGLVKDGELTW